MAIRSSAVAVATSSSTLIARGDAGAAADPMPVLLTNQGASSVFFVDSTNGDAGVLGTTSGYEFTAGKDITATLFGHDSIYLWTPSTGGVRVDRLLGRQ